MMMIQQVYPHFPGQQISPGTSGSVVIRNDVHPPTSRIVPLRHRSVSPPAVIYKPEPIFTRPGSPSPTLMHKFEMRKIIKRSSSVDEDLYRDDHPVHLMQKDTDDKGSYDSDHEIDPRHHEDDYHRNNEDVIIDEDDAPLDLSLPVGRRCRNRTYSGTESDDSGGPGEEKTGGKAAYKKNLMKRYCKYI